MPEVTHSTANLLPQCVIYTHVISTLNTIVLNLY